MSKKMGGQVPSPQQYEELLNLLQKENVTSEEELRSLYDRMASKNPPTYDQKGKPLLDDEGGCLITPASSFVVKAKVSRKKLEGRDGSESLFEHVQPRAGGPAGRKTGSGIE